MQTLNVDYNYQVGVIEKTLTLPKHEEILNSMSQKEKNGDPLFWVDLILNGMKMPWYYVFIFIFCLERTVREQLDKNVFCHIMVIFSKVPFWNYLITAMFKVLLQQLRGTLTAAFERHLAVEDFTDMDQYRCQFFLE